MYVHNLYDDMYGENVSVVFHYYFITLSIYIPVS